MWAQQALPKGLSFPTPSTWDVAIGHHGEHVSLDQRDGEDSAPAESFEADVPALQGGATNRLPTTPDEDDLGLLTDSNGSGFFGLTAHVATCLASEEPQQWSLALSHHRAVSRLLRAVLEPFAAERTAKEAALALHAACTRDGRWLPHDELISRWEHERRAAALISGGATA
jgi:hypothetical protein